MTCLSLISFMNNRKSWRGVRKSSCGRVAKRVFPHICFKLLPLEQPLFVVAKRFRRYMIIFKLKTHYIFGFYTTSFCALVPTSWQLQRLLSSAKHARCFSLNSNAMEIRNQLHIITLYVSEVGRLQPFHLRSRYGLIVTRRNTKQSPSAHSLTQLQRKSRISLFHIFKLYTYAYMPQIS